MIRGGVTICLEPCATSIDWLSIFVCALASAQDSDSIFRVGIQKHRFHAVVDRFDREKSYSNPSKIVFTTEWVQKTSCCDLWFFSSRNCGILALKLSFLILFDFYTGYYWLSLLEKLWNRYLEKVFMKIVKLDWIVRFSPKKYHWVRFSILYSAV